MSKQKEPLMIPFNYYYEDMLDYYEYKYSENPNSRKITWNTNTNHSVWTPRIRGYKYNGESDEKFEASNAKDKINVDLYNKNLTNGTYIEIEEIVWKPNYEFEDKLKYLCYSRGRSSAKIHFQSEITNRKYEMFLTDFDDLMKGKGFNKNIIEGTFTFCKRGANYGIKCV